MRIYNDKNTGIIQVRCLSTEAKPTGTVELSEPAHKLAELADGDECFEADTAKAFVLAGGVWMAI